MHIYKAVRQLCRVLAGHYPKSEIPLHYLPLSFVLRELTLNFDYWSLGTRTTKFKATKLYSLRPGGWNQFKIQCLKQRVAERLQHQVLLWKSLMNVWGFLNPGTCDQSAMMTVICKVSSGEVPIPSPEVTAIKFSPVIGQWTDTHPPSHTEEFFSPTG